MKMIKTQAADKNNFIAIIKIVKKNEQTESKINEVHILKKINQIDQKKNIFGRKFDEKRKHIGYHLLLDNQFL